MIVHLGVILVAVALVASNAYTESTELRLRVGEPVEWSGHTFELVEIVAERDARTDVARANVRLDGDRIYGPAITTYLQMGQPIGTPSVRTGLTHDVYLTIAGTNAPVAGSDEAVLEVFRKPLILWLWIGGLMMAVGTVLSAFPGAVAATRSTPCRRACPTCPSHEPNQCRPMSELPTSGSVRRVAPLVVAAIAVVLVGLFLVLLTANATSNETARSPLLGNPAPAVPASLPTATASNCRAGRAAGSCSTSSPTIVCPASASIPN